ncbi:MAG: DUF6391 domain-containing protein [Chloroflexota bacterium]
MLKQIINSIRRNHALEHATITLMLAQQGPMRVVGRAGTDGFYVYANVATNKLEEFAHEALGRLQRGEASLAVSPLCGTNIAVAGILAGTASVFAVAGKRSFLDGVSRAVTASMFAIVASQPIGRLIQKNYTTSPDLEGVRIVSVEPVGNIGLHKVRTAAA